MTRPVPVVYILHGDDEFAISNFLAELSEKVGDPATTMMNTTRLDGRALHLEELRSAVSALPFLAKRRLVIVTHPLAITKSEPDQEKFTKILLHIPHSTALVLVEYNPLTPERERRQGQFHWLEGWADSNKERCYMKYFSQPKGSSMARWIQNQALDSGGKFSADAADLLANLVGDDTRMADQEIQKLLAFANYGRQVETEDVEALTEGIPRANIFSMVDALSDQDPKKAMGMLQNLLELQDPMSIFGMVIRQFRLLILARDIIDRGGGPQDLIREYKVKPKLHHYVADKAFTHARHFQLPVLEATYHRLLEIDEQIKTGGIDPELALVNFVAAFTSQKRRGSFH